MNSKVKNGLVYTSMFMLMVAGGFLAWWGLQTSEAPEPEVLFSADSPDTHEGYTIEEAVLIASQELAEYDSGVAVPDLGIVSPMMVTGSVNGWLELPDPPWSTLFDHSQSIGEYEGSSIVSSHVDYGFGKNAPFHSLYQIDKGTPTIIKSEGQLYVYEASAIELYEREGLPEDMFRSGGDPVAYLVTCSGETIEREGELPFYENNLVVATDLLGKADVIGNTVTLRF